ncbi:MAG: aspartate-semialdehyde dehydrogenase [Clostridia bacterium]|nr:aspartate-semialdehyde dehydrogenase [Clostridia bacterium]
MTKKFSVAIVGATGLVGKTMLNVLHERKFPIKELVLFGAIDSEIDTPFGKKQVYELNGQNVYHNSCDFALFAVNDDISVKYAQIFATMGAIVIDNSAAWRLDDNVPLVIPEVNPSDARIHNGIIANPNCTTIQILTAISPLHRNFGIDRMVVSTYQSVSGAGMQALSDLESGEAVAFDRQIKNNLLPKIGSYLWGGYTNEELKIKNETHKILSKSIKVNATCVRVPTSNCHGATINIKLNTPCSLRDVSNVLTASPSIIISDSPTPLDAIGSDIVFVGRLRRDETIENGFSLWTVADNLRKGAATNAVQIAELFI